MGQAKRTLSEFRKPRCNRRYRRFPHSKIGRMWEQGKTISQIANAIDRVDKDHPNGDRFRSMRNCLHRMHTVGYKDENGRLRRLPHRVSRGTVRKARHAGLRAW